MAQTANLLAEWLILAGKLFYIYYRHYGKYSTYISLFHCNNNVLTVYLVLTVAMLSLAIRQSVSGISLYYSYSINFIPILSLSLL